MRCPPRVRGVAVGTAPVNPVSTLRPGFCPGRPRTAVALVLSTIPASPRMSASARTCPGWPSRAVMVALFAPSAKRPDCGSTWSSFQTPVARNGAWMPSENVVKLSPCVTGPVCVPVLGPRFDRT
jgi:hypothetical protein